MVSRRKFIAISSAAVTSAIGGAVGGLFFTGWNGKKYRRNSKKHSQITEGTTVALEPLVEGLDQPLALENPIEDHIYLAAKSGQIYLYYDGALQDEPILDLRDKLVMDHGEQGLLGLEFHPDFENNRRFYVRYSSPPRGGGS